MDHLSVNHGISGSTVTCTGCDVVWQLPPGPMVGHLDRFAQLHFRCGVTRRGLGLPEQATAH